MEAILLKAKTHGENAVILTVFSKDKGKVRGLLRGGRKKQGQVQPGNIVKVVWKRRLQNQLGNMSLEVLHTPSSAVFHDEARLLCLRYLVDTLERALADEEPHANLYENTVNFLDDIARPGLWQRVGFYELQLLVALGYGLSLRQESAVPCDQNSELAYVSPKSGRAVSEIMGRPYHTKLLRLPMLFGGQEQQKSKDFLDVFRLTGHFLERAMHGKRLDERRKLLEIGKETGFSE